MGGGGDAWKANHAGILDHARGLHYDHVPGVALPSADADRATWTSAMDKFNAWKAREVAKEGSGQAWWQTYQDPGRGDTPPPRGDDDPPPVDDDDDDPPIGPFPKDNVYFPQLTHAYEAPNAQDWSQYMPSNSPFGGMGGLLYQPGTEEYHEQFPMPENIWNYQPPRINRQPVTYTPPPFGPINVTAPEDLFQEEDEDDDYDWANDPEGRKGGPGERTTDE